MLRAHRRTAHWFPVLSWVLCGYSGVIQSSLYKTDGTPIGPSLRVRLKRNGRLLESQMKGVKKARDQLWVFI